MQNYLQLTAFAAVRQDYRTTKECFSAKFLKDEFQLIWRKAVS